MNVILVPCLGFDTSLITKLADSVDVPIKHKVVVNNSGNINALDEFVKHHPDWQIYQGNGNMGCGPSWNMAEKLFPDEDRWIIMNDDSWFGPGAIQKLIDASKDQYLTFSSLRWSCFVWSRKAVDAVGTFDENYWPVYFEDTDMWMRFLAEGIPATTCDTICGHHKPTGHLERYYDAMSACHRHNEKYLTEKWGPYQKAVVEEKPYKTPFNKGGSVKDWKFDDERRMMYRALWKKHCKI